MGEVGRPIRMVGRGRKTHSNGCGLEALPKGRVESGSLLVAERGH